MSMLSGSASSTAGVASQGLSFMGTVAGYLRLPALASVGIAAILTTMLYFKQKALIYPSHVPPNSRTEVPLPSQFGLSDFEDLMIPTPDGEKLSAFYIRGPRNKSTGSTPSTTIVMFHGNAGNIGHRLPIARMLVAHTGCNVFMPEYRGYGLSTGEADEAGLVVDAQAVFDYLRTRAETRGHRLVVYGQSLGGAVSLRLVASNQDNGAIAGLVLENTFLSMRKLIPSVIPPARFLALLCHQVWPSDAVIGSITKIPMLFLSGLRDEIVPPQHMSQLFDLARTPDKTWKVFPGGDHNSSVIEEGYFDAIAEFIASCAGEDGSRIRHEKEKEREKTREKRRRKARGENGGATTGQQQ